MRTTTLLAALSLTLAACADSAPERTDAIDERAAPDLALTQTADNAAVASHIELHQTPALAVAPIMEPVPGRVSETAENESPVRVPVGEPIAAPETPDTPETDASGMRDSEGPNANADPAGPASGTNEGGGKPTVIADGRGTVPDRDWSDPTIFDEPGIGTGPFGRGGGVIIRGGAGGIDDDCAIHARVPLGGGGPGPTDALVNDRGPRQGTSINERAPRSRPGGSMPRGAGFPSRGRGIR